MKVMIETEALQPQTAVHADVGASMQKEASLMENLLNMGIEKTLTSSDDTSEEESISS